jgi:hypothetical protein
LLQSKGDILKLSIGQITWKFLHYFDKLINWPQHLLVLKQLNNIEAAKLKRFALWLLNG